MDKEPEKLLRISDGIRLLEEALEKYGDIYIGADQDGWTYVATRLEREVVEDRGRGPEDLRGLPCVSFYS